MISKLMLRNWIWKIWKMSAAASSGTGPMYSHMNAMMKIPVSTSVPVGASKKQRNYAGANPVPQTLSRSNRPSSFCSI